MISMWCENFFKAFMYTLSNLDWWNGLTLMLFIVFAILFVTYTVRSFYQKNIVGHKALLWTVAMNITLCILPFVYVKFHCNSPKSLLWMIIEQVGNIVKMFVGEVNVESEIYVFADVCPLFVYAFALGIADALMVTFFAAASALSDKIANNRKINNKMKSTILGTLINKLLKKDVKSCDIIIGCDDESLEYAVKNDAVVLKESSDEISSFQELIANGYTVLNKDFTVSFLKSSYFKKNNRYNFIYLGEARKSIKLLNTFINYLDTEKKKKNIYFYAQVPEDGIEMVQNHISNLYQDDERIHRITVFGRNELVAREFVENEPITKYMPDDYVNKNFYINPDKTINVVMVGFTKLNREILRQYVMNNQLATFKDGAYQLFGINYHIFANGDEGKNWAGFEVDAELTKLKNEAGDDYFKMPELPWNGKINYYDSIPTLAEIDKKIFADIMKENTYTCVIIDTGDIYLNMKIENKLSLLLAGKTERKYHIYVRRGELFADKKAHVDCYGEYEKILDRDIIIGEKLLRLAKMISNQYLNAGQDAETEWKKSSYFNMFSNIYAANNLRLKLNLMGFDYEELEDENRGLVRIKENIIRNINFIKHKLCIMRKKHKCKNKECEACEIDKVAPEEIREILAIPKEIKNIKLEKREECRNPGKTIKAECEFCSKYNEGRCKKSPEIPPVICSETNCEIYKEYKDLKKVLSERYHTETIYNSMLAQEHYRWNAYHLMSGYLPKRKKNIKDYSSRKDNLNKKHALITGYNEIADVSEYLYIKGNVPVCELGFYENDGLIFEIIPDYFEENNFRLIKKKSL